ncbi:DUF6340 family protein [Fluviicola taffensis]|uniref:Tetratricopeptide repeat protein n=1 Tax=Fluviicola taffensis (strain DSM 16823 / NCIMB 13979 / RW262) TaxID=755732 RepID=F2IIK6_FLUTR|nr:DUF6340 family protein [Fluviicola taffensis]AEA45968.1 hypothetical protein Fluta_4005 [Fluviicola taffensis DSM 16823]
MKQILVIGIISTLIFSSCRTTQGMRIQVQKPSRISVNKAIKTITLLNHSIPGREGLLEGTLTLETPKQDKELSNECIRGIDELLRTSERFQIKRCDSSMLASKSSSIDFGTTMNWDQVDSICKKYETDALLVLEFFDTDFSVINPAATAVNTVQNVLNGNSPEVQITGKATARAGFRLYYPATKTIEYEDRYKQDRTWVQRSTNPIEAIARLIKRNDALIEVSYYTGESFAHDLVPLYFWQQRMMYIGKKDGMKIGARQALTRDWEGALKTWLEVYESSPKAKFRARAAYNIALAYEVLNDLQNAKKWVQTSYVEGGKSEALEYSNILENRIKELGILENQLTQ